jgi:hypothetical protein
VGKVDSRGRDFDFSRDFGSTSRVLTAFFSTLNSRLSSIASLSNTSTKYLWMNYTPSRPHSPPHFSFIFHFSLFFHTLGNDDQHLAAAARHQYALYSVLSSFSFIFTDIFLTVFLSMRCNDELYNLTFTTLLALLASYTFRSQERHQMTT